MPDAGSVSQGHSEVPCARRYRPEPPESALYRTDFRENESSTVQSGRLRNSPARSPVRNCDRSRLPSRLDDRILGRRKAASVLDGSDDSPWPRRSMVPESLPRSVSRPRCRERNWSRVLMHHAPSSPGCIAISPTMNQRVSGCSMQDVGAVPDASETECRDSPAATSSARREMKSMDAERMRRLASGALEPALDRVRRVRPHHGTRTMQLLCRPSSGRKVLIRSACRGLRPGGPCGRCRRTACHRG